MNCLYSVGRGVIVQVINPSQIHWPYEKAAGIAAVLLIVGLGSLTIIATLVRNFLSVKKVTRKKRAGGQSKTQKNPVQKIEKKQSKKNIDPKRIGDIGEYKLDVQLRQMPNDRRYLNDIMIPHSRSRTGYSQIDHILITRYGLFVIEMKNYSGKIKGKADEKNWWVNGKFPLYNPIQQNRTHIRALQAVLNEYRNLKFVSVVVFTKRCELYLDNNELRNPESDEFVIADIRFTDCIETKLKKLKRENSVQPLSESDVLYIFELIQSKNLTDPKIRAEHSRKANQIKLSTEKDTKK
jgi:hypothetical protein